MGLRDEDHQLLYNNTLAPSGGEIFHRLENLRFRTDSELRCLPNVVPFY